MRKTAMLWTGGKDSALALHEVVQSDYHVCCLVTFAPPDSGFLAHPLPFIKLQAQALALPHYVLPICEPFEEAYEKQLRWLRDETGITGVITGDISEVGGCPNWIRERCRPVGLNVHTPLWERDRDRLLQQLLETKFKVVFSCVDTRWLPEDWVGRELDESAVAELRVIRERTGLDLCGENGEYHTLVTDGPQFTRAIEIRSYSRGRIDSLAHLEIHESELQAQR